MNILAILNIRASANRALGNWASAKGALVNLASHNSRYCNSRIGNFCKSMNILAILNIRASANQALAIGHPQKEHWYILYRTTLATATLASETFANP